MATTGQATEARHPHPLTKGAPGLRLVPANQTTRCGLWRFNLAEHHHFWWICFWIFIYQWLFSWTMKCHGMRCQITKLINSHLVTSFMGWLSINYPCWTTTPFFPTIVPWIQNWWEDETGWHVCYGQVPWESKHHFCTAESMTISQDSCWIQL